MKTGKALLGVLGVFAVGAVMGAYLASEKGSGTRKKVSKKGRELAEALNREIDLKFEKMIEKITGQNVKSNENDFPVSRKAEKAG